MKAGLVLLLSLLCLGAAFAPPAALPILKQEDIGLRAPVPSIPLHLSNPSKKFSWQDSLESTLRVHRAFATSS